MKRSITRTKGYRYCTVTISLENGRLSITGDEGRIMARGNAKKEAIEYWRSCFEENPSEIYAMGERFGKHFRGASGAARFVVETDGELHGLDVTREEAGKVFISEGCGQIVKEIRSWFPEVIPLLPWHLNDMHAGCEHQDKAGLTDGACVVCGYKYRSAWLRRELPADIVALASEVLTEEERKAF